MSVSWAPSHLLTFPKVNLVGEPANFVAPQPRTPTDNPRSRTGMPGGNTHGDPGRAAAGTAPSRQRHLSVQRLSLALLVLQNSVLVMAMHHSRNSPTGTRPRYYASTAVLLVEMVKLLASLVLATHDSCLSHSGAPVSAVFQHLCRSIFAPDSWKLVIPAALYTLQNSLVYVAISNLDAVTFQVTYQLKILTTVLFSILLLGRSVSLRQWLSLVLLTLGVALVQVSGAETSEGWLEQLTSLMRGRTLSTSNAFKGLMAVVAASATSGLTCVYFEKLVKDSMASASLWTRNVQLSFFSLFPAFFIGVLWQDGTTILRDGFFAGYNSIVWATIGLQALGGLIVAVCIAYADNVAKNFAGSLSIVVSYGAMAFIFRAPMTLHASVGALAVVLAMCLFNSKPTQQILLLPMRQERHALEKANRPLLAELTSVSTSTKKQESQE